MVRKPLSVARHDFIAKLCETCNHSGLPAFVMMTGLEEVLELMKDMANKELERETAQYKAALEKEAMEEDDHADT